MEEAPKFRITNLIGEECTLHLYGTPKQLYRLASALELVAETNRPLISELVLGTDNGAIVVSVVKDKDDE